MFLLSIRCPQTQVIVAWPPPPHTHTQLHVLWMSEALLSVSVIFLAGYVLLVPGTWRGPWFARNTLCTRQRVTVLSSAGHFAVQRWAREEEKVSMSKPRADSNRTLVTADLKCASGGSVCWPPAHTVPCLTGPFEVSLFFPCVSLPPPPPRS